MVKWTPKAVEDIDWIREHIAENFTVDRAIEVIDELIDFVESMLSKNPLAGAVLSSNPIFSKLVYEGNSVFYVENPKDRHIYIVYVQPRGTDFQSERVTDVETD